MKISNRSRLVAVLKEFGKQCYWYGEETGDYDMKYFDQPDFEERYLDKVIDDIVNIVEEVWLTHMNKDLNH